MVFLMTPSVVLSKEKPNILWITIEDTSPHFIGCYGNRNARTPNIDRLAAEGVRFTNAFSTGTVCSPSRTAIITGVKTYKTGTGNHRSKYPVPDYIKGFPYYLQQAGYYTSNNKKTDYNVADELAFIKEAWNESSGEAGWWNRKPGQPFFSVFNFMDSHQSRTMTNPYSWYREQVLAKLDESETIGEYEFEMPPFYRDSPEMRKQFARVYCSIKLTDNEIGELLDRLKQDDLLDSTIIFFYADHGEGIPRGKTNGINLGYRVPFIIWFPERYEHLSPWGTGGVICDELIDFTDLAPTLIDIAGGEIPDHLEGRSFIGKNKTGFPSYLFLSNDRSDNGIDRVRTVTDGRYLYSRNYMPFMPEARYIRYMEIGEIKQFMRNDFIQGKLDSVQQSLFEPRPAEFLFDLENDLWEVNNLAANPAYSSILKSMRKMLEQEIISSRDVVYLPEYELALMAPETTAYEFRRDEEKYPIEDIQKTASKTGFRGKDICRCQVEKLTDKNQFVRYWAILGLRSQNLADLKQYCSEIQNSVADGYPPVAITAAAILYGINQNKAAEMALKNFARSENEQLSLMAINYLLYLKESEDFVTTVQAINMEKERSYNVKAACMDFLQLYNLVPIEQETLK